MQASSRPSYIEPDAAKYFYEAIKQFPSPDLEPIGDVEGYHHRPRSDVERWLRQEYIFTAGHLAGHEMIAIGWIELRTEQEEICIAGTFDIARYQDWFQENMYDAYFTLSALYDRKKQHWTFWLDHNS